MRLRPAGPDDADAIARTLDLAFAPLRRQYTPAAYAATVPPAEAIRSRFPEAHAWLAELDGEVVGTVTARETPDGVYVQSMAVVPSARGHGVGRLLMGEAIRFARDRHARRLYLSTTPFLDAAIALYRSCGFAFVQGAGPSDLHGTPLLTMELRLEPPRTGPGVGQGPA